VKAQKACAAIVNQEFDLEPGENRALIKVKNADLAMAKLLEMYVPESPAFEEDIHPTAVIHHTAIIGKGFKAGAGAYVGAYCIIGKDVTLYPNTTILDHCTIGDHTTIWPGAVIQRKMSSRSPLYYSCQCQHRF